MKVNNQVGMGFSASGVQAGSGFRIAASGKAFDILSSGLYSRKAEAVVRELSCNAVDGHIAAGRRDVPIEVQLPTEADPTFAVRDEGIGLSKEMVMELYTTYFASTKSESNDFTGAFGLGSKAPFAYTDSFTVISTFDGVRCTYVAAKGADGSPTINLLMEECVEGAPSGVEVSFPVEPQDFQSFHQAAVRVFQHFEVPPTIYGGAQVQPMCYDLSFDLREMGAGYRLHLGGDSQGYWVVMGNVAYPLSMGDATSGASRGKRLAGLLEGPAGVTLELPIGAVSVAASREDLQYDKQSREVLASAADAAIGVLESWVEAQCKRVEETFPGMLGAQLMEYGVIAAKRGYLWNAKSLLKLLEDATRVEGLFKGCVRIAVARFPESIYCFTNRSDRGRVLSKWRRQEVDTPVIDAPVNGGFKVFYAETSRAERALRHHLNSEGASYNGALILMLRERKWAEDLVRLAGFSFELTLFDANALPAAPESNETPRERGRFQQEAALRVMDLRNGKVEMCPVGVALEGTGGVFVRSTGRPVFSSKELVVSEHLYGCIDTLREAVAAGREYFREAPPHKVMVLSNTERARLESVLKREAAASGEEVEELILMDDLIDATMNFKALDRDMRLAQRLGVCGRAILDANDARWLAFVRASALVPETARRALKAQFRDTKGGAITDFDKMYDEAVEALAEGERLSETPQAKFIKRLKHGRDASGTSADRYIRTAYGACADEKFISWHAAPFWGEIYKSLLTATPPTPELAERSISQLLLYCGHSLEEVVRAFGVPDVGSPSEPSEEPRKREVRAKNSAVKVIEGQLSLAFLDGELKRAA